MGWEGGEGGKGGLIGLFSCYLLNVVCSEPLHVLVGVGTVLGWGAGTDTAPRTDSGIPSPAVKPRSRAEGGCGASIPKADGVTSKGWAGSSREGGGGRGVWTQQQGLSKALK